MILGTAYLARNPLRRELNKSLNAAEPPFMGNTDTPLVWFEITSDNKVRLHSPKVEMGQGTFTGLAQLAADELEVDVTQIEMVHAETITGNVDGMSTGGSTSIASLWQPLRELAATMREMLKLQAAKQMGLEVQALEVSNGVIASGSNSMTYGQVVDGVTEWEIPEIPALKDANDFKFIGKPVPRLDLTDKVVGTPMFGIDASMPDMLFGAVVRPSQIGAKFISADATEAHNMPGVVRVVEEEDFIGVVAHTMIEAENAKKVIKVEWQTERNWSTQDIEDLIKVGNGDPMVIQKTGNAKKILEDQESNDNGDIITAEFKSPIGAHAQLEPNGAVAFVESDKATIMISTQVVSFTRKEVAERLGFDEEQVNVIPTYLGGGFGRRLHTPNAVQAALMSKAVGKPVKCFFDRKEEFQNDTFRPPTHHLLKAKLDSNGMIEAFEHNVSSGDVMYGSPLVPGFVEPILGSDIGAWRGGMIQYGAIPNFRAVSWRVKLPFATSWWRSLGLLANTFAIESFLDELALKNGKNPVEFRLQQIQNDKAGDRLRKVIEAAADKANYTDEVVNGIAMGFAASTDAGTPCAHVAEVSIENKQIKVHKVTCSIDPGIAVNPDQVKAQCEGSIIMGISASMFERMYVEEGQLRPIIYGPYQMALMRHAPKDIDVIILENNDKPGAVGEPPLGPIGAAIANAVFRLTSQRLREMPLQLA